MSPLLLAAAVTIRAAFPTFAVEGVPGRYADALPDLFMAAMNRGTCAETVGDASIDEVTNGSIAACNAEPGCVTDFSSNLVVDFVVLGSLRKEGTSFRMKLDVVDASRRTMAKRLDKSFDSLLNGVPGAIGELSASLCKVLQTQKPLTPAVVLAQRRAKKDSPPPVPPPSRPKPSTEDLSLDLPLLPENNADIPLTPTEPPPPPPVVAARPPEPPAMVVPLPTPPPAPVAPPPPPAVVEKPRPVEVGPPAPVSAPPSAPEPAVAEAPAPLPPEVVTPPVPAPPGPSAGEVMAKLPWNWILVGAAAVSTGVGVYYGASSQAIWGRDRASVVGGVPQHTITRLDANEANKQAVNANISFAVAGALAAGGGVLFLVKF